MTNPYTPPQSELLSPAEQNEYKTLRWKILFFILLPLELWPQYDVFFINEFGESMTWRICSLAVSSFFYISLYGLSFRRSCLTSRFWLFYLPVMIAFDCYEIYKIKLNTPGVELNLLTGMIVIISPLLIITWYSMS